MGSAFARSVIGIMQPSVGLLNVGSEEIKGHEALHEAASILRKIELAGDFHGFVEGDDIAKGAVDVNRRRRLDADQRILEAHLPILTAGGVGLPAGAAGHA